ncbi:MAG: hypothetical protein J6Z43_07050, partial [Clostridiales bacterium]|nr:hypothetical protein [Clostridiales bacterium]
YMMLDDVTLGPPPTCPHPTGLTVDSVGIDYATVHWTSAGSESSWLVYINGNNVDVAKANVPQDMTLIRMNVDNFDEAYEMLISKGFRNSQGDKTVDSATNKSAMMISPSGFAFDLCQHIVEDKQESIFNMLEQVTGGAEEEVKEEEFVDLRPSEAIVMP